MLIVLISLNVMLSKYGLNAGQSAENMLLTQHNVVWILFKRRPGCAKYTFNSIMFNILQFWFVWAQGFMLNAVSFLKFEDLIFGKLAAESPLNKSNMAENPENQTEGMCRFDQNPPYDTKLFLLK